MRWHSQNSAQELSQDAYELYVRQKFPRLTFVDFAVDFEALLEEAFLRVTDF